MMKNYLRLLGIGLAIGVMSWFGFQNAAARDYTVGSLKIENPWTRATPKGSKVAGGYLRVTNRGEVVDRLSGGTAEFAARVEIHEMRTVDGVMRMRPLPKGLEIKPGATVELRPGSYHVMFMGLKRPLKQGERVSGTLSFERAGTLEVEYVVEAIGSAGGHDKRHGH